jgi:hypothetical protein
MSERSPFLHLSSFFWGIRVGVDMGETCQTPVAKTQHPAADEGIGMFLGPCVHVKSFW